MTAWDDDFRWFARDEDPAFDGCSEYPEWDGRPVAPEGLAAGSSPARGLAFSMFAVAVWALVFVIFYFGWNVG